MSDVVTCAKCGRHASFIHWLGCGCDSPIAEAAKAGVVWYGNPEKLTEAQIDPLLWPVVQRINASGWVWTGESCQGHPDATHPLSWGNNVRPMLRFICRAADAGRMLYLLTKAMYDPGNATLGSDRELPEQHGFTAWPHEVGAGWFEVLVYVEANNVWSRNAGVACYARFAEALHAKT